MDDNQIKADTDEEDKVKEPTKKRVRRLKNPFLRMDDNENLVPYKPKDFIWYNMYCLSPMINNEKFKKKVSSSFLDAL